MYVCLILNLKYCVCVCLASCIEFKVYCRCVCLILNLNYFLCFILNLNFFVYVFACKIVKIFRSGMEGAVKIVSVIIAEGFGFIALFIA